MKVSRTAVSHFCATMLLAIAQPEILLASDDEHHHSPHNIELFLGNTSADHNGKSENAATVALSYRYWYSDQGSVGALVEYAREPLDHWIVGVPLVFALGSNWQFTAMPGMEFASSHTDPLFRVGIGYEFKTQNGLGVKPEVNVDWVDDDIAVVFGVSFAFGL